MHTGKWWWATQRELEKKRKGATIIPVIISSDKTLLTLFRNRTAYPVYLTIGNIPKGHLSKAIAPSSDLIMAPLKTAGADGMTVVSGDGVARRGHPILAAYVGDYPERIRSSLASRRSTTTYGGMLNNQGIPFYVSVVVVGLMLLTALLHTDVDCPGDCKRLFLGTPLLGQVILAGLVMDAVLHRLKEGVAF
ncbi:hypothetical protein B0H10DRAFT_1948107 [Mycena sp. CBHHK59/15]|nr:hypothetical protein B0H10DRAFT_1948107 [Mycena sp. CBHHK59/15]